MLELPRAFDFLVVDAGALGLTHAFALRVFSAMETLLFRPSLLLSLKADLAFIALAAVKTVTGGPNAAFIALAAVKTVAGGPNAGIPGGLVIGGNSLLWPAGFQHPVLYD